MQSSSGLTKEQKATIPTYPKPKHVGDHKPIKYKDFSPTNIAAGALSALQAERGPLNPSTFAGRTLTASAGFRFSPVGAVSTILGNSYVRAAGHFAGGVAKGVVRGLGASALAALGGYVGSRAGKHLGKYTGINEETGGDIGALVGGAAGLLVPFKTGGKVNRTGPIYAHKGEFVLPKGLNPTRHQRLVVQKKRTNYQKDRRPFKAKFKK